MNGHKNVHILLPIGDIATLDQMAEEKTKKGPAVWTRSSIIREAIKRHLDEFREYSDWLKNRRNDAARRLESKENEEFIWDPEFEDGYTAIQNGSL